MKILCIAHRLPWPPIDGGKICMHNSLQSLASLGHQTALFCLAPHTEASVDLTPLRQITQALECRYIDARNRPIELLTNSLFGRLPYNVAKYYRPDIETALMKFASEFCADVVWVEALHMCTYLQALKGPYPKAPCVLRQHNVESTIVQRYADRIRLPGLHHLMKMQAKRLRTFEGDACGWFEHTVAITNTDATELCKIQPALAGKLSVIPAAISARVLPSTPWSHQGAPVLLHVGSLDWQPNVHGLRWFIEHVLPLVVRRYPKVRVRIAGKCSDRRVLQSLTSPRVDVLGFIDDIEPLYDTCSVGIVPLQVGSGMRVKILDYMTRGVPVVSTTIGAEGIDVVNGKHLLVADSPGAFADAILRLFDNPAIPESLRRDANRRVADAYGLEAVMYRTQRVLDSIRIGSAERV